MRAVETTAPFGRVERLELASFTPQMEDSQSAARESPPACLGFGYLANSLVQLLETARRELERDPEVAKASLVTASNILQAEVERYSSAGGTARGGLAPWQMLRVRAFIDSNLHRSIHIRDLCAVVRRSPAYFCRKFKLAVGEPPHAYVMRRRLERACHLMVTSASPLTRSAPLPDLNKSSSTSHDTRTASPSPTIACSISMTVRFSFAVRLLPMTLS